MMHLILKPAHAHVRERLIWLRSGSGYRKMISQKGIFLQILYKLINKVFLKLAICSCDDDVKITTSFLTPPIWSTYLYLMQIFRTRDFFNTTFHELKHSSCFLIRNSRLELLQVFQTQLLVFVQQILPLSKILYTFYSF